MGADARDVDNDGRVDLFQTALDGETMPVQRLEPGDQDREGEGIERRPPLQGRVGLQGRAAHPPAGRGPSTAGREPQHEGRHDRPHRESTDAQREVKSPEPDDLVEKTEGARGEEEGAQRQVV